MKEVIAILKNEKIKLKSVDVLADLTRCNNCAYGMSKAGRVWCAFNGRLMDPSGYCSSAEPKEVKA